jgi:hypothetical protein
MYKYSRIEMCVPQKVSHTIKLRAAAADHGKTLPSITHKENGTLINSNPFASLLFKE